MSPTIQVHLVTKRSHAPMLSNWSMFDDGLLVVEGMWNVQKKTFGG